MKQPFKTTNIYTARKSGNEEYYKTNDKDELGHLRKSKRYLEEQLEQTKTDFKKTVEIYDKKVYELTLMLKERD